MDMMDRVLIRVGLSMWDVSKRIERGGSFITVERRRAVVRGAPWSVSGNQK